MSKLEQIVEQYADTVYRFCCNMTDNYFDAEELFQETFLRVMENPKKIMAAENPRNFILGIAVHLEKNRRRKKRRRARIAPEAERTFSQKERNAEILDAVAADEKSVEMQVIEKEQLELIRRNLAAMKPALKIIASLYYGEELSIREIAELLKLPQGTVKSRLYKIREELRKGLEEQDES